MSYALPTYFGLTEPFTLEELKTAYRRLAHRLHPDKGGSKEAFQTLQRHYRAAKPLCQVRRTTPKAAPRATAPAARSQHTDRLPEAQLIETILTEWALENSFCELLQQQLAEQWGVDNSLILLEYLRELLKARHSQACPSQAWQVMLDKYGHHLTRVLLPWSVAQALQVRVFHS